MSKLEITLVRSLAGAGKKQLATAEALGLKKIGQSVVQEDNDAIRGMVRQIEHLVSCQEA